MKIEISDETLEYLKGVLHGAGAEAYYCGGIHLDLEDYDGAIKNMANSIEFYKALMDGSIAPNIIFHPDIKRKDK